MLVITVPAVDAFDEVSSTFVTIPETTLQLEHSLVSLSKWESDWEKPFLTTTEKTDEETKAYVKAMTLNEVSDPRVYENLSQQNYKDINDYLTAKMTATWFAERKAPASKEVVTAEVIYYWLVAMNIPFECQYWHLNRLFTLIKVVNEKNQPDKKKMSRRELAERNRRLNAERKAAMQSRG